MIRGGPACGGGPEGGRPDHRASAASRSRGSASTRRPAGSRGPRGPPSRSPSSAPTARRRTFRLVRRHVEVESVAQAKIVDPAAGVGYIQLTGFQKTSTEELDRAIAALQRQGMRYLVLDLRGNPGGLLNVAVEIADRFVDQGVIVSTRGRAPGQSQVYRAKPDKPYTMPLAVLIDHDSASASEILAGALKDHAGPSSSASGATARARSRASSRCGRPPPA